MSDETLIYHFTHKQNLPLILEAGALRCTTHLQQNNQHPINIAHQAIQERRAATQVPHPPHGTIHDYIPFYFATRQPMLYAIHRGNVEGFTGHQNDLIYLVSNVSQVQVSGRPYLFTDGHPTMAFTRFYTDWTQYHNQVDWELMAARYWQDTDEDPDRKRRRQAEFLIHQQLDCTAIIGVATMTQNVQQWVIQQLENTPYTNWHVAVRREWYF